MLTAGDIAAKRFEKSIGGYRVEEVDSFIRQMSEEFGRLTHEKEDLEHKLEVLAEKLIEYREDEESLRTALLGAQKLGDSVIRESRTKAEIILRDATIKAERLVENAQRQIERERAGLISLQNEVASFKNSLLSLYKQHLELVSALPGEIEEPEAEDEPAPPPMMEDDALPADVQQQTAEQEQLSLAEDALFGEDDLLPFDALTGLIPDEDADAGESLDSVFAAEEEPVLRESRFGALRFGEGYDLKQEDGGKRRR